MKAKYRCRHCRQELGVTGRRVGGRLVKSKSQRNWDRIVTHLKVSHPEIAQEFAGFTRRLGFRLEDHTEEIERITA